jgi:FKBP-type peptidyl-prolyl cis-trans isomerase
VEKRERRELEKQRVRAEEEAKRAEEEADRKALADIDAEEKKKVAEREEVTGLETTVLYKGNDLDFPDEDDVVSVHVKMTMVAHTPGEPDEILENSRKRRRPFKFKVNGGAVISGEKRLVDAPLSSSTHR